MAQRLVLQHEEEPQNPHQHQEAGGFPVFPAYITKKASNRKYQTLRGQGETGTLGHCCLPLFILKF